MKNLFDNIKKKKEEIAASIFSSENDSDKAMQQTEAEALTATPSELKDKLIDDGFVYYIPTNFDMALLIEGIKKWLAEDVQQECAQFMYNDINILQYQDKKGVIKSLGFSLGFHLYLIVVDNALYFDVFRSKWIDEDAYASYCPPNSFEKGNLLSSSQVDEITEFIGNYLLTLLSPDTEQLKIPPKCRYIEPLKIKTAVLLYNLLQDNEILLSFLEISSIKKFPTDVEFDEDIKADWYFVMTSLRIFIFAMDKRGQMCYMDDLSESDIIVKSEIGRNTVAVKGYEWLTTLSNGSSFGEIENCQSLTPIERIREIARLLWLNDKKSGNMLATAFLNHLLNITDNPFDELTLLFVEIGGNRAKEDLSKNIEEERLESAIRKVLHYEHTGEKLLQWRKRWAIDDFNSIALIKVLLGFASNDLELKRILPFHRHIREEFGRNTKDEVSKTLLELEYCRHLLNAHEKQEAARLLTNLLTKLPDETISELLPAENIEPQGKNAGQFLRVSVYELLTKVQTDKEQEYILKLCCLQPLSINRLMLLEENSEGALNNRVNTLITIYAKANLSTASPEQNIIEEVLPLDNDLLENALRHPASRTGGAFEAIKEWIAEVKIPDQSIVQQYSEKLDEEKHSELTQILRNAEKMFGLKNINCFVSRGKKHIGINAFEATPPFLLVGIDHITPGTPHFLNNAELKYVIGNELAHLHFKHARITSNDVWKGAAHKSSFVLDTIMSILPGVGLLGNGLQKVKRLNSIALLLQKTEKIAGLASTGKDIFDTATQILSIYKTGKTKEKKEKEQEKELLLTSRLMQLTADRAGLILSGSPMATIRSIIITSDMADNIMKELEEKSLMDVLNSKDENENYRHTNLTIRVAALFSFYLSDDYIKLRKALMAQP